MFFVIFIKSVFSDEKGRRKTLGRGAKPPKWLSVELNEKVVLSGGEMKSIFAGFRIKSKIPSLGPSFNTRKGGISETELISL